MSYFIIMNVNIPFFFSQKAINLEYSKYFYVAQCKL